MFVIKTQERHCLTSGLGRLGGGSHEPLRPDTDWRAAQRLNWREEEQDRGRRHWDREDRQRRPLPHHHDSPGGFDRRRSDEYHGGDDDDGEHYRYGDLDDEYYFRGNRREERGSYYRHEEEGGSRRRQDYQQRLPDFRYRYAVLENFVTLCLFSKFIFKVKFSPVIVNVSSPRRPFSGAGLALAPAKKIGSGSAHVPASACQCRP